MKLILTQEVDGLGAPGDVVEVKDGYGRNYLVPRGLAIRWTRGGEKTVESIKKARSSRAVRDQDHAEQIKTKLEAQAVSGPGPRRHRRPPVRCGHHRRDRRRARRRLRRGRSTSAPSWSTQPIKTLGSHQVSIKLHDEVSADRGPQRHPCLTTHAARPARPLAPVRRGGPRRVAQDRYVVWPCSSPNTITLAGTTRNTWAPPSVLPPESVQLEELAVADLPAPVAVVLLLPRVGQGPERVLVGDALGGALHDDVLAAGPAVGPERAGGHGHLGVGLEVAHLLLRGAGAEREGAVVPGAAQRDGVRPAVGAHRAPASRAGRSASRRSTSSQPGAVALASP